MQSSILKKTGIFFAIIFSFIDCSVGEVNGKDDLNAGIQKYVLEMKSLKTDFLLINSAESAAKTINKWASSNDAVFKVLLDFAEKNPDAIKGPTPPKEIAEAVKSFQAASEEVFQSQRAAQDRVRLYSADIGVQIALQRLQVSLATANSKIAPLLK